MRTCTAARPPLLASLLGLGACLALAADGVLEKDGVPFSIRTEACTANNFKALEAVLPNVLLHALKRHPSDEARVAARFLAEHPAYQLRIGVQKADAEVYWPRPSLSNPAVYMRFERFDRQFLINHAVFHAEGHDERDFLRGGAELSALADSVAGSFIHEISHARELGAESSYTPHVMDDELVAAYREMRFLLDALTHDPAFDRLQEAFELQGKVARLARRLRSQGKAERDAASAELSRLMPRYRVLVTRDRLDALSRLDDLRRSTAAFETGFARAYPKTVPYLSWDSARELAEERKLLDGVEAALSMSQARLATLAQDSAEAERERERERQTRQIERIQRLNIQFWSTPEEVGRARANYAILLDGLRYELGRSRKTSSVLKRFTEPFPEALRVRFRE